MTFPSDICETIESSLSARPTGPNQGRILDDDWEFASCLGSDDRAEIVVPFELPTGHMIP